MRMNISNYRTVVMIAATSIAISITGSAFGQAGLLADCHRGKAIFDRNGKKFFDLEKKLARVEKLAPRERFSKLCEMGRSVTIPLHERNIAELQAEFQRPNRCFDETERALLRKFQQILTEVRSAVDSDCEKARK